MFNICWCTDSLRVEKFTLKMFLYCCNNWQCFSSRASTPSRHITTMHFGLFGKKRKKTCRVWVNESGRSIQCSLLRCKYTNTNAHQQETWHGLHGHIFNCSKQNNFGARVRTNCRLGAAAVRECCTQSQPVCMKVDIKVIVIKEVTPYLSDEPWGGQQVTVYLRVWTRLRERSRYQRVGWESARSVS